MSDNKYILNMLAETYIHPGSGQSTSHVDQPVSRESITDYPFISSTSLKGAFRSEYRRRTMSSKEEEESIFGKGDAMGRITFSDGRLLLLPVRSLEKLYYWVTCPYILERLNRDIKRIGGVKFVPELTGDLPLSMDGGIIHLEEREIESKKSDKFDELVDFLKPFLPHEAAQERLAEQLVVLSNEDFKWYANYGLPVLARNKLDENTKSSDNVWYEEYLPVDTVMYCVIFSRAEQYQERSYFQIGGNETVGQGWFRIKKYGGN